jgi:hypothetical protein
MTRPYGLTDSQRTQGEADSWVRRIAAADWRAGRVVAAT